MSGISVRNFLSGQSRLWQSAHTKQNLWIVNCTIPWSTRMAEFEHEGTFGPYSLACFAEHVVTYNHRYVTTATFWFVLFCIPGVEWAFVGPIKLSKVEFWFPVQEPWMLVLMCTCAQSYQSSSELLRLCLLDTEKELPLGKWITFVWNNMDSPCRLLQIATNLCMY